MKKICGLLVVFAVGFFLCGCLPIKAPPPGEIISQSDAVPVETPPASPQSAQVSPITAAGQEGQNNPQELQADPQATKQVGSETPVQSVNQTPTPHVDVNLRATDPNAFILASGKYQLVEFFAFWCPTCKSLTPVLKNLENKYTGKIQFIYLDIDDPKTNSFKQALGYQYQPHIFLIDGQGKVLRQWVGYVTEEELDAVLSSLQ